MQKTRAEAKPASQPATQAVGNSYRPLPAPVDQLYRWITQSQSGGKSIDPGIRRILEQSFQTDLSAIRIHTSSEASALPRAFHASALATGTDIFFSEPCPASGSDAFLGLIAHEVAHVIQQARGSVRPAAGCPVYLSTPDDPWEQEADLAAAGVLAGLPLSLAAGLADVSASSPSPTLILQCHDSFEHRALGDIPFVDLKAISTNAANRTEILEREIKALQLWQKNPESVTAEQLKSLCPAIRTIKLSNGLLVTYGELNALPDFVAGPLAADSLPRRILLPILQAIRQESYIQLNKLLGRSVSEPFAYSIFKPGGWPVGLLNKLFESNKLDALTAGIGIKQVDHYSALLARNASHVAPFSWYRWQTFHNKAREVAKSAFDTKDAKDKQRFTNQAWIYNGYADNFLQDSFAAGHLVNKTLVMQWFLEWAEGKSNLPVADWDRIKNLTTSLQPELAGRKLYRSDYTSGPKDPQTIEEQITYALRLTTSGIKESVGIETEAAYQNYISLLANVIAQASAAAIYDDYNRNSLSVASVTCTSAYKIWGDNKLFSDSNETDGTCITSEITTLSQQAIVDLLTTGKTAITEKQIRDNFPSKVRGANNEMLSLEAWNDTQKSVCTTTIFPRLEEIVARIVEPRISNLSRDQDLATPWRTSLPDSGTTVASILQTNQQLFVASNGSLYQLEPLSGQIFNQIRLSSEMGEGDYSTCLVSDGKILFVGVGGFVYGVPVKDWSQPAWMTYLPEGGESCVEVFSHQSKLFASTNGYVYELNPVNGEILHTLHLSSTLDQAGATAKLVATDECLYVGSQGAVYAVDTATFSALSWTASLPQAGSTAVELLLRNNRLFAGANGTAFELHPKSGEILQSLSLRQPADTGDYTTRLSASDSTLFVGTHGSVRGISLNDWSRLAWSTELPGNQRTVVNVSFKEGQLFAGTFGSLHRLSPSSGLLIRSSLLSSKVSVAHSETRILLGEWAEDVFVTVPGSVYGVTASAPRPMETGSFNTGEIRHYSNPWLLNSKPFVYSRRYPEPLKIAMGVSGSDISTNTNMRIHTTPSDQKTTGFTPNVNASKDTSLYYGETRWLALPANDANFQIGTFSTLEDHPRDQPKLATSRRIEFERPYASAPEVVVWINEYDIDKSTNVRISAYATDIDSRGFTIHIDTWDNTILYAAGITWIAYPVGLPGVASGTYGTQDVRPRDKPRAHTIGTITFPTGRFTTTPRVISCVCELDIDRSSNTRLGSPVSNESATGFTWNLLTWHYTVLYSAKANYIALSL